MKKIILYVLVVFTVSCSQSKNENKTIKETTTYYLVRHAEKDTIPVDNPISQVQGSLKARAFVDKVTGSEAAATILYHQNENTGFLPFSVGGTALIDSATPVNTGTILSDSDGEVNPYSGDLLYVESRAAVERTTAGTEDIKITIQF